MKCLTKILAVIGALVTIGAILYVFRDKLKALCPCCREDLEPEFESETPAEPAEDAAEVPAEEPEATAEPEAAEEPQEAVAAEEFVD